MKKTILSLGCALLSLSNLSVAQIQIGSNAIATFNKAGNISKPDMERFKKSTTVFTLQYKDYKELAVFEKMIQSIWTVTPYKIIKPDEIGKYMKESNISIFSFDGIFVYNNRNGSSKPVNMHLSYDLWMPNQDKKNSTSLFAKIMIYPESRTFIEWFRNATKKNDELYGKMLSFLYNDAEIYNWSSGLLKGYLKKVNDNLIAHEEQGVFTSFVNKEKIKTLQNDTLYIPDYVNIKFNMFTGAEKEDEEADEQDFSKAYPYPIKFVSVGVLNNMIINGNQPIKYLVYTKSSTDKYINVFESGQGTLLYANYTPISYNFKSKDLAKIAKNIK
jgi:hypothetical protein